RSRQRSWGAGSTLTRLPPAPSSTLVTRTPLRWCGRRPGGTRQAAPSTGGQDPSGSGNPIRYLPQSLANRAPDRQYRRYATMDQNRRHVVVGAFLVYVVVLGLWVGAIAFWIAKLVEVVRIPETQYRAAGSEKTNWMIVVILVQVIGALIWQFSK